MNNFTLDGRSTSEWGIGLSAGGAYDAPARKGESISVPGRNGNIWVDDGSFENVMLTYPCWMSEDFDTNIDGFRAFLSLHSDQYYELRDTYHPNEYRLARYAGAFTPQLGTRNKSGRFDVVFDCQPQRFLDSGYSWRNLTIPEPSGILLGEENPTGFDTKPVFCFAVSTSEDAGIMIRTRKEEGGELIYHNLIHADGLTAGTYYYLDLADMTLREGSTADSTIWEDFDYSACPVYLEPESSQWQPSYAVGFFKGYNLLNNFTAHLSHFSVITRYWTI